MDAVCENIPKDATRTSPRKQTSSLSIKYTKPNLGVHSFHIEINDLIVSVHVISMDNSIFMWIGKGLEANFTDLSLAMMSPFQNSPLASKVVGSSLENASVNLSSKLSRKLDKQVFLSCNILLDQLTAPVVEKRIIDEIKSQPEKF